MAAASEADKRTDSKQTRDVHMSEEPAVKTKRTAMEMS